MTAAVERKASPAERAAELIFEGPGQPWAVVDSAPVMLGFQKVPEPKQSPKNRLHLDVQVGDALAAAERAEALGARRTGFVARRQSTTMPTGIAAMPKAISPLATR